MVQAQVIEGTSEEIAALLQAGAFAGQKLRVIVESEEEDFTEDLPTPANTVRDAAHLEQLLLEGLASPVHEVTEETWEAKRQEVRRRHEARQQQ
jgi:hypothetical protein